MCVYPSNDDPGYGLLQNAHRPGKYPVDRGRENMVRLNGCFGPVKLKQVLPQVLVATSPPELSPNLVNTLPIFPSWHEMCTLP